MVISQGLPVVTTAFTLLTPRPKSDVGDGFSLVVCPWKPMPDMLAVNKLHIFAVTGLN